MNGEILNFKSFPPHPSTASLASLPQVDTCLAAARSHSGENNTQLFSNTLVPLRYLKGKAFEYSANIYNQFIILLSTTHPPLRGPPSLAREG